MATSLWSSIIISFFVGLFVGSAIHSYRSANLLSTVSDCFEKCNHHYYDNIELYSVIKYIAKFGAIGTIEQDELAVKQIREMFQYWRSVAPDLGSMRDGITKKYMAFKDEAEKFEKLVDSINWYAVNAVLLPLVYAEIILFHIIEKREYLELEEKIKRFEEEEKLEVQSEEKEAKKEGTKEAKKEGKAKRRRRKKKWAKTEI